MDPASDYYLFLDDYREIKDVFGGDACILNWVTVINYDSFVDCIELFGVPKFASFDHDLHPEHYNYLHGEFPYDMVKYKTGWHCMKYLVNHCKKNNTAFPHVYIHTANPIGRTNMVQLLKENGYYNNIRGVVK